MTGELGRAKSAGVVPHKLSFQAACSVVPVHHGVELWRSRLSGLKHHLNIDLGRGHF